MRRILAGIALPFLCAAAPVPVSSTAPITVAAAEAVYGDVARQVGGGSVAVTSILANADQDPHLFEITPSAARAIAAARLVIYNGLDYDPWMVRALAAAQPDRAGMRRDIAVAALAGTQTGDDPHVWYSLDTIARLAAVLAAAYAALDPSHAGAYAGRLAAFDASLAPIRTRMQAMRARLQGVQVTATEPMFDGIFTALGMVSRNRDFQRAVMNATEVSASSVAAFESDLRGHAVALMVFNSQATNSMASRMRAIAVASGVPVVGAAETKPPGQSYQDWVMAALDSVERAVPATVR